MLHCAIPKIAISCIIINGLRTTPIAAFPSVQRSHTDGRQLPSSSLEMVEYVNEFKIKSSTLVTFAERIKN